MGLKRISLDAMYIQFGDSTFAYWSSVWYKPPNTQGTEAHAEPVGGRGWSTELAQFEAKRKQAPIESCPFAPPLPASALPAPMDANEEAEWIQVEEEETSARALA
jgi:hypothetical protein